MSRNQDVSALGTRAAIAIGIAAGFCQAAYAAPGDLIGSPIVDSTAMTTQQPEIASDANGNVVAAWVNGDGNIVAQRYAKDGTALGAQMLVAQAPADGNGSIAAPRVAVNAAGRFSIIWEDVVHNYSWSIPFFSWSCSPTALHAKTFAADGSEVSGDTALTRTIPCGISSASVAMDDDGDFAVSWVSHIETIAFNTYVPLNFNERSGVYARVYTAAGRAKTRLITLATGKQKARGTATTGDRYDESQIGMDGAGNFTVVWDGYAEVWAGNGGISGQSFDARGTAQNAPFVIGSNVVGNLSMAMNHDGQFAVAWTAYESSKNVQMARGYGADDAAAGDAIDVLAGSSLPILNSTYSKPRVAIDGSGNFAVSATANIQDDSELGNTWVKTVRLFAADGTPRTDTVQLPDDDHYQGAGISLSTDAAGDVVAGYAKFAPNSSNPGDVVLQWLSGN